MIYHYLIYQAAESYITYLKRNYKTYFILIFCALKGKYVLLFLDHNNNLIYLKCVKVLVEYYVYRMKKKNYGTLKTCPSYRK